MTNHHSNQENQPSNNNITAKKVVLCILDGWGIADKNSPNNAIAMANLKFYPQLINNYPNSRIGTSGLAVGLPEGQIGNSEVGHITIGAGRVIFQDLPRINLAIQDNSLANNHLIQQLIKDFANNSKTCHLIGLVSDGGVHSHIDHLIYLANLLVKNNVKVQIHCFLDGRDVAQKSAKLYLDKLKDLPIATISGRYYAMDRDNKWDRIKLSAEVILQGNNNHNPVFSNFNELIAEQYHNNITDEFFKPATNINYQGTKDGDGVIFVNFRADRARQISYALFDYNFKEITLPKTNFSYKISFTEYSGQLNQCSEQIFPPQVIKNSLAEILSKIGKKQLRIAETEKYAHVTFFFSCGKEECFAGEERILIPSPNVATYDLKPEMSANEVTEELCKAINSNNFDFIAVNFANADMVGHSGNLSASILACQSIDKQLEKIVNEVIKNDYYLLITADHGNIEQMTDNNNNPHTCHTTNLVPLILVGNNLENYRLIDGSLQDIAPTIMSLLNITKPKEMTGKNLEAKI